MVQPEVSVLMSCYNASPFVSEAIESVLAQSLQTFELVVVDDGSTDNTAHIVSSYARTDGRIVLIPKDNSGLADSLNLGLANARGKWIARLDADDVAMPDRLSSQLTHVARFPRTVLLGTGWTDMDGDGNDIKTYRCSSRHHRLVRQLEKNGSFFAHSCAWFNRTAAVTAGGYNTRFTHSQDWDLWLRLSRLGHITSLPRPLVRIRKHPQQLSGHKGGDSQALMGMAASVCHFLRERAVQDPSTGSDEEWQQFLVWLQRRMQEHQLFRIRHTWLRAKEAYNEANKHLSVLRFAKAARVLLSSRHGFQIVRSKVFGSDLPRVLAQEWEGLCAVSWA